uniref:RNA helicase n=2 Tax=Iconisemion striatum TaxID=60296 RepID=A0A1A7WDM5_9TELE
MPKSLKQSLDAGLGFIDFLGNRISNKSKQQLREIYNNEFRNREGAKHPNFSNVLYALFKFNIVVNKSGTFYRTVNPLVRVKQQGAFQQPHNPRNGGQKTQARAKASAVAAPVLTSKKERAAELLKMVKTNRKRMTADKKGIVITSDPETSDGKVHFSVTHQQQQSCVVTFHIENKGTDYINFTNYTVLDRICFFSLKDERRVTKASPVFLCPGEHYDVVARCTVKHYGYFPTTICFEFQLDQPKLMTFCIVREISVVVQTTLAAELGPIAPYKMMLVIRSKPAFSQVVEGVPPPSSTVQQMTTVVKLGDYKCPYRLNELVKQRMDPNDPSPLAKPSIAPVMKLLASSLEMKNYARRFHLLLYLEEAQMEVDIRNYDLHNQTMTQDPTNKKLLVIKVPGVAENRPSVLRGDCLKVTRCDDKSSAITVYKGYVHKVELDRVKLGLSTKLLNIFITNMKFDVEFTINKLTLKLQHRAVDLAEKHRLGAVLFPSGAAASSLSLPELSMYNRQLEKNPEQSRAVRQIVAGSSKPAPYIIFGPPGTGKTITVVEAITQVKKADPSAHILACAPSNAAADLLCDRLRVHMNSHQLYRMYASSLDPSSVHKDLLKYCNWDEKQGCFVFPEKEVLMEYKILVTTLYTAGRLVTGGVHCGHFTHVFVDEAGQAEEPQCIIAVAGLLCAEKGQLVLAGDPKQLGPIIRSSRAMQHGLGLSLLERLMQQELYKDFQSCYVTKLLQNYRSHEAILKVPNEEFYDKELQVLAGKMERETYCHWEALPQKGFPVIFHGVLGKDEREANSPSFFNVSEIEVLVKYLQKLEETQGKKGLPKLSTKDIGIITPYRKQVEKIKKALKSIKTLSQWGDLKDLKVGSVEEFQGQERKIIMVSTVRSSQNYVKMDKEFNIGFLSNEKRFNVALTRAKSLLIVVGNPVILRKDPVWKKFITYCLKMKGYVGFDFKDAEEEEDDFEAKLASLRIIDSECPDEDGSAFLHYVSPEWKNEL